MSARALAEFMFPRLKGVEEMFYFGDLLPMDFREQFYREMAKIDGAKLREEVKEIQQWLLTEI